MTTYEITTTKGRVVRRKSDAHYVAASETEHGRVRFHKTHAAAKRAAGTFGTVHAIEVEAVEVEATTVTWRVVDTTTEEVRGTFEADERTAPTIACREAGIDFSGARIERVR